MLPVAILAGGLAMRLRPATATVPKALLPFAGRPFIHWQLELLARRGIGQVVLCVGFLGEQIQDAVGSGADFGITVRYSFDGGIPRGTGGALRRALPMLGEEFFVLYGDSYLDCSFAAAQAAYELHRPAALLTVFRNADRWERSNVLWRNGAIVEYNKHAPRAEMAHVDYGLAVLSARSLSLRPAGSVFDLADVYHELSVRGELAGLEVGERFYEIGSLGGIEETERHLSARAGR
jgi:N-acetyl-alpha-D-muramate 1-phosphate uridylyltransferase